jgi:hypothetical protein
MTAADFTQLQSTFESILAGTIGDSKVARVSVSGADLLADASAVGAYADHQIARVDSNAQAVFSTEKELVEPWYVRATEWALNLGDAMGGWIYRRIQEIGTLFREEYKKLRDLLVRYYPVLLVPGKALRDAKRWMTVRTHLNDYRDAIDKDYINVTLKDSGGIGWQGPARDRYWSGLQKQYDAAGTMMGYAASSSSGVLMFANGVARVLSSFAAELYAVLVKVGEFVFSPLTLSLSGVISAFNAVVKQFAAMGMYFTSNYLLYGWPDPTSEGGYPTVQPDGTVTPLPVLQ